MKTKITELFGIEHPIIQGGMHHVGFAELAAAVSNAGGLGTITGLTQGTPKKLANEIARCKEMTDKPFAVNLTFLPSLTPPDYPGLIKEIIDAGVPVVETAGRNPAEYLPALKEAGIKIIHKCTSVRHSLKAQDIGCGHNRSRDYHIKGIITLIVLNTTLHHLYILEPQLTHYLG